ncbi:MAG: peptide chain release factor N(5)-glutamine methyltransferase [Candidatus Moraniibacteriota bacterium]
MLLKELQNEFLVSGEKKISPADFFVLLSDVTKKEKTFLLAHPEYSLSGEEEKTLRNFFERRLHHEPVAYIIGHKEFYGYDFIVTPDTLVPRPETELMVELALNKIESGISNLEYRKKKVTVADIGTGSGNIIISLVKEVEKLYQIASIKYYASDISEDALIVAKENAKRHNVDKKITFHQSNLLESSIEEISLADEIIILANLPYLSEEIYESSPEDVKNFEPKSALISDQDGLNHYYRLFEQIKNISKPPRLDERERGWATLFLEISPEQASLLKKAIPLFFPQAPIKIHKDLAQKDRVVEIRI